MTSPAHRATLGFLHGALVAIVAQVLAVPLAAAVGSIASVAPLAPLVRVALPVAGFAFAGAVGGEALGAGRSGAPGFAAGGLATGLVLTLTSPHLAGLTGHEDGFVVAAYAAGTFAAAFGLGGCLGIIVVDRRSVGPGRPGGGGIGRATAAFTASGALGGLVSVLPFFLPRVAGGAAGTALELISLASAVGSVAIPLGLGGALTARVVPRAPDPLRGPSDLG
jgi:hypothetical protein